MYCPNCKQNIPDTTGFCPHCGTPVQVSSNANMNGGPQYQQVNYDYDYDAVPEDFNLFSAYASMFKKYAKFKGRSRRKEYWLAWLMNMIITLVMMVIMYAPIISDIVNYGEPTMDSAAGAGIIIIALVLYIYVLALMIPSIAMTVRRLHDIGKSGWFCLIAFIPFGGIILFVFECMDGNPGPNRYGPDPKGRNINQNNI